MVFQSPHSKDMDTTADLAELVPLHGLDLVFPAQKERCAAITNSLNARGA